MLFFSLQVSDVFYLHPVSTQTLSAVKMEVMQGAQLNVTSHVPLKVIATRNIRYRTSRRGRYFTYQVYFVGGGGDVGKGISEEAFNVFFYFRNMISILRQSCNVR
jgi:hypothetical protein